MKSAYIVFLFSTVLTLLFTVQKSHAFIQIETGKVVQEITDLELSDGTSLFEINRFYTHGGKNKSLLGSSWCFDFEEELRSENDGFRLYVCGKSSEVYFKSENNEFYFEQEKMVRTKNGQLKRTTATEIIKYDEMGKMISRAPKSKNSKLTKFYYDESGKFKKITYLAQYQIEFNYDGNGKISSISTKGRRIAAYSVIEENLVSVKNSFGEQFSYDYDDLGYLISVKSPDERTQEFSYNKKTRLISNYMSADGCVREFEYSRQNNDRLNLKTQDSCAKDKPLEISFSDEIKIKNKLKRKTADQQSEFVVKRDGQFRVYKIEDQTKVWAIEYNDEKNKIVTITEITKKTNKAEIYKAKYKNGQIYELTGKGKDKVQFVYTKEGGLLKIKTEIKNKKAKAISTAKFEMIHAVVSAN